MAKFYLWSITHATKIMAKEEDLCVEVINRCCPYPLPPEQYHLNELTKSRSRPIDIK
jgi:hypothetical protein